MDKNDYYERNDSYEPQICKTKTPEVSASCSNDLLSATVDWMIVFEDAEMKPEVFTDHFAAQKRFEAVANNWNCHLFQRVDSR